MENSLIYELERRFKKCSDCGLHQEYRVLLNKLLTIKLSQELVDYLCDKATSKTHIWEIKLDHLRILLLNPSAREFDLKAYYLENIKKSRRLAMTLFHIRGFAIYASEEELLPFVEKFCKKLERNHDYIDYNYILSSAGLPYLVETYDYPCFKLALQKATEEHSKIDPLLKDFFTINENLEQANLLPFDECHRRLNTYLQKQRRGTNTI